MANVGQGIRYGSQGAAIGNAIIPGIGGIIGGAAGFFGGMFGGKSEEEERQERLQRRINAYLDAKNQNEQRILQENAGAMEGKRMATARQMAARGVSGGNIQQYLLPEEQGVIDATQTSLRSNDRFYDAQIAQANAEFSDRPIEPNFMDYVVEAGSGIAQNVMTNRWLDAYKGANANNISVSNPPLPSLSTAPIEDTWSSRNVNNYGLRAPDELFNFEKSRKAKVMPYGESNIDPIKQMRDTIRTISETEMKTRIGIIDLEKDQAENSMVRNFMDAYRTQSAQNPDKEDQIFGNTVTGLIGAGINKEKLPPIIDALRLIRPYKQEGFTLGNKRFTADGKLLAEGDPTASPSSMQWYIGTDGKKRYGIPTEGSSPIEKTDTSRQPYEDFASGYDDKKQAAKDWAELTTQGKIDVQNSKAAWIIPSGGGKPVFRVPEEGDSPAPKEDLKVIGQIGKIYDVATDSDKRLAIMIDAEKDPNPQNDVALLFNHIGMTLSAQKGARITNAEIERAISARSISQDLLAMWQKVKNGQFLTPEQRKDMVALGYKNREVMWKVSENKANPYGELKDKYRPETMGELPPLDFLKKNLPEKRTGATRFILGGKIYDVDQADVDEFKKDNPDAKQQ